MERIPQSVAKLVVFRAFLASDGKTVATGKTIAITISKNGGAFGNPNAGATNATEISSGFYKFTLDTTDTGTVGPLAWRGAEGTINDAADIYTVCTDLADLTTLITTVDTVVDGIAAKTVNLPSDPADASVVAGLIAAVDTKIDTIDNLIDTEIGTLTTELAKVPKSDGTATWNATALASLQAEATDALNAYDPPTHAEMTTRFDTLDATLAAAAEIQDIVDAVLDEANADHLDVGSVGLSISTGGTAAGLITTNGTKQLKYFQLALRKDAAITTDNATEVAEINADEGSGAGAFANTTDSQEAIADAAGGSAPTAAAIRAEMDANSTQLAKLGTPAGASMSADIAAVKADTAAVKLKTDNLPSDPADASVIAGRFDTLDTSVADLPTNVELATSQAAADDATLAAISTLDGKIDTIDNLLDTEIGALTTELAKVPKSDGTATWNATALASLQAEATDALNAYDPPTHAEVTAAVAAGDDATLAAIAALNNISAAQVNAEVVDALNVDTYAEPTGVPAATATLVTKIGRLHQALRNRVNVTATKKTFYNDADSALWEKDLSDNGTDFSESEGNAI